MDMIDAALRTLHIHSDDVPWVVQGELHVGLERRVLHARPDEGFVVTQLRAEPGIVSAPHRHLGPVFGYTSTGAWGHDSDVLYRAGTYIYETPGVVHRFQSGGTESTLATFVNLGAVEFVDEVTLATTVRFEPADIVRGYFEACERAGLTRPNILD